MLAFHIIGPQCSVKGYFFPSGRWITGLWWEVIVWLKVFHTGSMHNLRATGARPCDRLLSGASARGVNNVHQSIWYSY